MWFQSPLPAEVRAAGQVKVVVEATTTLLAALLRQLPPAPDQQQVEQQQERVADKAELLAEDGEDEIGVPLGQEIEVRLGPVEPALAGDAARTDRDRCLRRVVAGA